MTRKERVAALVLQFERRQKEGFDTLFPETGTPEDDNRMVDLLMVASQRYFANHSYSEKVYAENDTNFDSYESSYANSMNELLG